MSADRNLNGRFSQSQEAAAGRFTPPRKPDFDYAAQIRQLKEPIDPDSPFMMEWWSSPTPVDADFMRRQREDSAAIPLRVWLAVLDQGVETDHRQGKVTDEIRLAAASDGKTIEVTDNDVIHQQVTTYTLEKQ